MFISRISWEAERNRVIAPYAKVSKLPCRILSTAGHVKSGRKLRGPSRKAKYSLVTDSEPVPLGKGEKHPGRGVKKFLKPCAYNKLEPVNG